jgi:hypothetical protein
MSETFTVEEARKTLEHAKAARMEGAKAAVDAAKEEFRFEIVGIPQYTLTPQGYYVTTINIHFVLVDD